MLSKWYEFIYRMSTWPVVALLVVGVLLANLGFSGRRDFVGYNVQLLDGRRWYTPAQVAQLMEDLGEKRSYYALTELTLDLFFPIVSGLLFCILILRTWGPRFDWLVLIPAVMVIFDLLENSAIVFLALTYQGEPTSFAWVAAVFTLIKSIFYLVSLLVVLNGGIIGLIRR